MKSKIICLLAVVLCLSLVFAFAACGKKPVNDPDVKVTNEDGEEITAEATEAPSKKNDDKGGTITDIAELDYDNLTAEELLDKIVADRKDLTLDEYATLISTFSFVDIDEDLDLVDNITSEAIRILRNDDDVIMPAGSSVFQKLVKSESPQVRGYVMGFTSSLFGTSDTNLALLKEAIENETEPYVLKCAVSALSNEGGTDPVVGQFLIDMAKHENKQVRLQATYALGNYWSQKVDGAVDTIIALMSDEDKDVRSAAYRYSSKLGDEAVIAPIVEMLNDPELYDYHDDGIISLNYMWYNYPFHDTTSETAYNAVMDYLKNAPRTENTPPWNAISDLRSKAESSFDEWKEKATYYNPDDIVAVMTDLIADPDINWLGRSAAIDVIVTHGTREQLEGLKDMIDGLTDRNANLIQSAYERALEED